MSTTFVKVPFDFCTGMSSRSYVIEIDEKEYFIPCSQVAEMSGFRYGDTEYYVVIPEWLAEDRGLIDYAEPYTNEAIQ